MKKLFIIFTFVLLVSLPLLADAVIKFDKTTVDFGEIESGKVVDLKFEFENAGDNLLIIKNISSSCGCTVAKLDKKEYKPGEKGEIPVKFFSRGYRGKVTKTITVSTNDKNNIYTRLNVTGTITLKDFAQTVLEPDKIHYGEVSLGKKYPRPLVIKNTGTIDLRIIEITHCPEISVEFDENTVKPKGEITVNIVFTPMREGKFTTFLKIRTNAYRQYLSIVKVEAEVKK